MSAKTDILLSLALVGVCLFTWFWLIPTFAGVGEQALMPRIAVALTGALSSVMLAVNAVRIMRVREIGGAPETQPDTNDDPFLELDGKGEPLPLLVIMAAWGVVITFSEFFGLQIGAALAMAVTFLMVGATRLTLVLGSLIPIIVLHIVFQYVFGLRVPHGTLGSLILELGQRIWP